MKMKSTRAWKGLLPAIMLLVMSPLSATACENGLAETNPDSVYIDHGDGTVTDIRSGLMWKRCAEGLIFTDGRCGGGNIQFLKWGAALTQADESGFAGYRDWRIPNLKELSSLVEDCKTKPAINARVFSVVSFGGALPGSTDVWSSSPGAAFNTFNANAYVVDFWAGEIRGNIGPDSPAILVRDVD